MYPSRSSPSLAGGSPYIFLGGSVVLDSANATQHYRSLSVFLSIIRVTHDLRDARPPYSKQPNHFKISPQQPITYFAIVLSQKHGRQPQAMDRLLDRLANRECKVRSVEITSCTHSPTIYHRRSYREVLQPLLPPAMQARQYARKHPLQIKQYLQSPSHNHTGTRTSS